MDDYLFDMNVKNSKYVQEATTYLEIFNYSVSVPLGIPYASANLLVR